MPEPPYPPGLAAFVPDESFLRHFHLSDRYLEHDAHVRPPIMVQIPINPSGSVTFVVDEYPTATEKRHEHWDVTVDLASLVNGERPHLTVKPSIHIIGLYHGWLTDGILSPG